jgi:hypothetical protein
MEENRFTRFVSQLGGKLGVAVLLIGFVVIFLGWNGAASFNDVRQQFPYLISGGIAGMALVVVGAALLLVEALRTERAELQSSVDELRRAIESMGAAVPAAPAAAASGSPASSDLVVAGRGSYHRRDCRLVQGREDRLTLLPIDEAEEQGLQACRICKP